MIFGGEDSDRCARCGRYPATTISDTWARRAQAVAQLATVKRRNLQRRHAHRRP